MDSFFKEITKGFSLTALASLIAGLLLLIYPQSTSALACYFLGVIIIIQGVSNIIGALKLMKHNQGGKFKFIWGLILLGIGGFFLLRTSLIISVIPFIFGLFVFASGIADMPKAIQLKEVNYEKWWISAGLAVVKGILGFIMLVNPFTAAVTMLRFIGGCLIYAGASTLWTIYTVSKNTIYTETTIIKQDTNDTFNSSKMYTGEYTQEISFKDVTYTQEMDISDDK